MSYAFWLILPPVAHPQTAIFCRFGNVLCGWVGGVTGDLPYVGSTLCSWWTLAKAGGVEGKVGLCRFMIRLMISVLLSASLALDIKRLKEKTRDFFPAMYVPPLVFFHFRMHRDLASCLIIWISQIIRPLPWYLGKWDLFGEEIGKQREYLEESWGTLGSCRVPWALC